MKSTCRLSCSTYIGFMIITYNNLVGTLYHLPWKMRELIIVWLWAPNSEDIIALRNHKMLLQSWYDIFVPHYYGTHKSNGEFTPYSSIQTLLDAINIFSEWQYFLLSTWERMSCVYEKISLFGISFWGFTALNASILSNIETIWLMYPVLDLKNLWIEKDLQEETCESFLHSLKEFQREYRWISEWVWREFFMNTWEFNLLSQKNIHNLRMKKIFIAHGMQDTVISYKRSLIFEDSINEYWWCSSIHVELYPVLHHDTDTLLSWTKDYIHWRKSL